MDLSVGMLSAVEDEDEDVMLPNVMQIVKKIFDAAMMCRIGLLGSGLLLERMVGSHLSEIVYVVLGDF